MTGKGTLISVDDLSVDFGAGDKVTHAVKNVSFDIGKGETVALVGESGSGKTVTALSIEQIREVQLHRSPTTRGPLWFDETGATYRAVTGQYPERFESAWPDGVRLQIHMMEEDEWATEDLPAARSLVAGSLDRELFLYPGSRHLFADNSLEDFDEVSATLLKQRVLGFLDGID